MSLTMTPTIRSGVGRGRANLRDDVLTVQRLLNSKNATPLRRLKEDGVCGVHTIAAIDEYQRRTMHMVHPDGTVDPGKPTFVSLAQGTKPAAPSAPAAGSIAWGAKVPAAFKSKVIQICKDLSIDPNHLMSCMAFESGGTFSPSIKNAAGSGATGLIQFMPSTAKHLGTTTTALAAMTAEQQLDYVKKYFMPYRGRLHSLEDVYMAIFTPKGIGKPADYHLYSEGTKAYSQNKGFDANKDGSITLAEISAKVRQKYTQGMMPGTMG